MLAVGALVQNFGAFPETGHGARSCVALACHAERAGFDSVWVTDHVVLPEHRQARYPHNDSGTFPYRWDQDIHEPLVLLGALAAATERCRIGVAVLVIPYRHPLLTAKMLATIDQLSEGRLILGAGVGWLADEFDALDVSFEDRGARTDEYLAVIRAAWTDDGPSTYAGRFVEFAPMGAYPKPVQRPHPPIWVGGKGPRALRRVCEHGDGYLAIGSDVATLAAEVAQLRAVALDAGRDPDQLEVALIDGIVVSETALGSDRHPLHGTPEQILDGLRAFERVGLSHLVVGIRSAGDVSLVGAMRALDAVAPVLAELRR